MSKRYKIFGILNDLEDAVEELRYLNKEKTTINIFFEGVEDSINYVAKLQAGRKSIKVGERKVQISGDIAIWVNKAQDALDMLRDDAKQFVQKLEGYGIAAIVEEYPWSEKLKR